MNNKLLTIFIVVSIFLLAITTVLLHKKSKNADSQFLGKIVFAKTYDQGNKVDRITIETTEGFIDIRRQGSYWHIANQSNYYADFKLFYSFINSINTSTYILKFPYDEKVATEKYLLSPKEDKEHSGMLITIFANGQKTDEVIIGLADDNQNYHFARNLKDENIWLIDGNFSIPLKSENWIITPILSLQPSSISAITVDKTTAFRNTPQEDFFINGKTKANVAILLNTLHNLLATKVINEKEIIAQYKELKEHKNIEITSFSGLRFIITHYISSENKSIFYIKLATTPLPNSFVNDYIKDNIFLYDGWYFELSAQQEQVLRYFSLI